MKKMPDGGKLQPKPKPRQPIVVTDPKDPRLKAYNDSLLIHNFSNNLAKKTQEYANQPQISNLKLSGAVGIRAFNAIQQLEDRDGKVAEAFKRLHPKPIGSKDFKVYDGGNLLPNPAKVNLFAKPVQPVVYQKPQQLQAIDKFTPIPKSFVGKDGVKRNLGGNLQYVATINLQQPEKIFPAPVVGQSKPAQITTPQQSVTPEPQGDYVYGPANSVIGTNVNGKFTPINMPEQRGAVNQADWDMLNNQESMKKYVQGKGLQYKCGGKMKGKKAAWGASLGTDQYIGGPDPIKLNLNGTAATIPVGQVPIQWDNPQPLPPVSGGRPSMSGGTSGGISGGVGVGAPVAMGGNSSGTATGAAPVSGGYSDGRSVGAQPIAGGYSNGEGVKPNQNQFKMPETSKTLEGSGGDLALTGLMVADALMPKEKIRRRYLRPEDLPTYNAHPYGTGSQAISEYGNTLKGKKKKAFWGAVIGAVAGDAKNKAAVDSRNAVNGIQDGLKPLMQISQNADQEAERLNNLYLSGGVQNMSSLQQVQPQMFPNQQPRYMANGGSMYGEDGSLLTGKGGETELKSYNPHDGGTFQFNGASHEDGGIAISYKGQPAEVEGAETAFKDKNGDLKIMGNLTNPLTGNKYKNDLKQIAKKEQKAQKLIDKGTLLLNTANPNDPYEALAFNAGKVMTAGGLSKQKQLSEIKNHLGDMQEAHLEIAKEKGSAPQNIFPDGGTVPPKKKWVYKGTNTTNLDAKIKEFADLLASKGIEGYSGERGGFRAGSVTKSGRTSRHAKNQALDIIPVAGEAAYQKILQDPELVDYMMKNGLTAINEYDPANAKKTGATAGHLHIGYDKGTKLADQFRQEAMSLYPQYNKKLQSANYKEPALNKGTGDAYTENVSGWVNKPFNVPPMDYTPVTPTVQTVEGNSAPFDLHQPAPINKPSNARGISPMQFLGEGYALATNQEEPVKAQLYNPDLYSPYQVSFQDRLNANQSTFNAVEKQLAYDPTSLATLAGQKYSADSSVLADEFRTNQGIANDIINKNVSLLNEAKFKNLGILDQQYVRQSQAKSNTKKINQDALSSISAKLLQKEASNNQLKVYENLYPNYAFNKNTGKAEYYGPDAASQIDWSGVQPVGNQGNRGKVETKRGNTTTTQYYDDPIEQALKAKKLQDATLNQFTPKPINITKLFRQK